MTATYNVVTIDGSEFDVFADVATADQYLAAEFSDAAAKWRDAAQTDADAKARALVSATRLLNRQQWPGSKTDEDQSLAWPRTGTGISGVEDAVVPQAIIDASILLAAEINNGANVISNDSTDDRIRSQQAGSVSISYFRDLDGGPRFPTAVQELLLPYLSGGVSMVSGVLSYGTDADSDFATGYSPVGSF